MNFFFSVNDNDVDFLKYNCFKLQHNWKVSFSVPLGTFFWELQSFPTFPLLNTQNVTEKLSEYFLLFLLFFKLQNNWKVSYGLAFGTNELCCFCTHPKRHWKYLWKCIYFRIQFNKLIEIVSNLTHLSTLKKVGQCECIL